MRRKQFKAESKRLLDLMINSIYTHKEIFLRELISNASDAVDKLCFLSLTDESVSMDRSDFHIRITPDKAARTLTISDNGIGMTSEELENNLGVIARSGSRAFKGELDSDAAQDAGIDIIGQFGVGFYSAFMVADQVTVISRAHGSDTAYCWESAGVDGYTITEAERDTTGTDIILHIKPDEGEEKYGIYLEAWQLKSLIKKYSDYIRWPILMAAERQESVETGETDEEGKPKTEYRTVVEDETVNSMVPIWQRSRAEASDADCIAFYKEKFHDESDPLAVIRVNAEGLVSYRALLFIPQKPPYGFFSADYQPGLQLYSAGVMIMERCADLMPDCFRFVRGIVDSPDLSLNISREMLQHDRQLSVIAANLEKKVKSELRRVMDEQREKYLEFYEHFGLHLKYGVAAEYGHRAELLSDLIMYYSADEKRMIALREYVSKMPSEQRRIYYAAAETPERAAHLPQTEQVRRKNFDILCCTDDVDEFVLQFIGTYEDKPFCNVNAGDLGLESADEKADLDKKEAESRELLDFMKETLSDRVIAVRLSRKLVSQPVCLTTEGEVTLEMEKYFSHLPGLEAVQVKANRVLELNAEHPIFAALEKAFAEDRDRAAKLTEVLHGQALLIAGLPIEDPSAYTELLCGLFAD
ncbi:MAG: molecular chaperone HtpG [Eubacteriales bacterium]|nr:molecular chaperone HtpG [Eubacteriales bacterium]